MTQLNSIINSAPRYLIEFIFCLNIVAMQTIDVPQSASLYRYLEDRKYDDAYGVACLGVTENDWRLPVSYTHLTLPTNRDV